MSFGQRCWCRSLVCPHRYLGWRFGDGERGQMFLDSSYRAKQNLKLSAETRGKRPASGRFYFGRTRGYLRAAKTRWAPCGHRLESCVPGQPGPRGPTNGGISTTANRLCFVRSSRWVSVRGPHVSGVPGCWDEAQAPSFQPTSLIPQELGSAKGEVHATRLLGSAPVSKQTPTPAAAADVVLCHVA